MTKTKLIFVEEHPENWKADTWVELIGEHHYAITQTKRNKANLEIIYLTKAQIEVILKEEEVSK